MESFVANKTNPQQQAQQTGPAPNQRQELAAKAKVPITRLNTAQNRQAPAVAAQSTRSHPRSNAQLVHQGRQDAYPSTTSAGTVVSNGSRVLVEDSQAISQGSRFHELDDWDHQNRQEPEQLQEHPDDRETSPEDDQGSEEGSGEGTQGSSDDGDDQDPSIQNLETQHQVNAIYGQQTPNIAFGTQSYPSTTSGRPDEELQYEDETDERSSSTLR